VVSFPALATGPPARHNPGMSATASKAPPFLRAAWRDILMVNFAIDPDRLRPFVPSGTDLDTWNGTTFVSVVGFRFLDTRVLGVRVPCHRDFDEVNLRFYVRRQVAGEVRRGVVFIKEIVPKRMVALVARRVYNENYVRLPMRSAVSLPVVGAGEGAVRYEWCHGGRWHSASGTVRGEPAFVTPGSEEEFVTEHYWGYSIQRDGSTVEYEVEHPQWRVWPSTDARVDCDALSVYGAPFVEALCGRPTSAFVCDGSEVTVRKGTRIAGGAAGEPAA
jgi:uncharacterized protein